MKIKLFVFQPILLLFLICISVIQLNAQQRCDPYLKQDKANPLSYHDYGDRCEGLYIEQVSGSTLRVVSLLETFDNYNLQSGKPLRINWDKPPGKEIIRLRAQGIKKKLYYRMDTYVKHDSISFAWKSGILTSLNILKNDIAVSAITKYTVNDSLYDVYLPVRISQDFRSPLKNNYQLILLPGEELKEIYISLVKIDEKDKKSQKIKDGEKLGYGYYPADRIIQIPITELREAGTYQMQIGATLKNGGSTSVDFLFYNPRKQITPNE